MRSPCRFSRVSAAVLVIVALLMTAAPGHAQAERLDLGDIAAGGDGTGTASEEVIGIHPDLGTFDSFFTDAPIGIGDGAALQAIEDETSELIDAVFIIEAEEMPINSAGVTFQFPPEDLLAPPNTWGQILKDRVGGEIITLVSIGGTKFDHGVGIHAAAGITYDLEALRAAHGPEVVGQVSAHAGMGDSSFDPGGTPGWVTTYIILSDDEKVIATADHRASTGDGEERGKLLALLIPPEAKYLTLAAGAGNASFYFNSGTFGDAFVTGKGTCLLPPAAATRDIKASRTPEEANGDFLPGDVIDVEIAISDLRPATPPCEAPAGLVIKDALPADWTPSEISDGGAYDAAQDTITWTISRAALAAGKKLSYKVTAAATSELAVLFSGTIAEEAQGAATSPIRGESRLLSDIPFDACGGIRSWNILGAFRQPFGDSPGDENLRLDYLTDGDVFETELVFFPGAQVPTAFGGDGVTGAASTGILGGAKGRNPAGVPTVFAWNDPDGAVNLNDDVFGGDPDGAMAYAQTYVVNTSGAPMDVHLGISSDDSVQVLLNGEEVWFHSIARGGSGACTPQDFSPDGVNFAAPHVLKPGENSLIIKVWEGAGGWNFALRFQNAAGEPITQDLEVRKFPEGVCSIPPLRASRSLKTQETVLVQCVEKPKWSPGRIYDVEIAISSLRATSASCPAPSTVRIEETVPPGWTPSDFSGGGAAAGDRITWTLTGAAIAAGTLSYKVKAAGDPGDAWFRGRITEPPSAVRFAVEGENLLSNPADFSQQGFVTSWLLLGPFRQPGALGASPGTAGIRRDHLTDGAGITEQDVTPRHGDTVRTDYGGAARSIGLAEPASLVPINPGGVPTWKAWRDLDDTIDFNDYYGGDVNQVMMYAVTYVEAAEDMTVAVGLGSDDSIQVLLDGVEIHINNIARFHDGSNAVQDVIPGVSLGAGTHKLMVKVFEGAGAHAFRLRFQDENGTPVTAGLRICINPECADEPPPGKRFHRGDADDNGELQLTDAIRILGFLFLGLAAPPCQEAADADNNGLLQLTDAIRVLGYLFLGAAPPAPPGPPPSDCGTDPPDTGDLGCEAYTHC
ncbi:MAG: NPCBM/NEW2 domain-containing protein [Planctomycetes bacterium]|nr:NPCBM/NEW2 domain-containing protein [Planctomycetota bacterium]